MELDTNLIYVIKDNGTKFRISSIDEERKDVYITVFNGFTDEPIKFPLIYIKDKIKNGFISGFQPNKFRIK